MTFIFWESDTFALLALYEARVLRGCPGDVEDLPPALEVAGQGEAAPDQIRSRHCENEPFLDFFCALLSLHPHRPQDLAARQERGGGEEEEDRGGRRNPRKRGGRAGIKCHFGVPLSSSFAKLEEVTATKAEMT